jgi:IclR family acetate operon transcriptional repressor
VERSYLKRDGRRYAPGPGLDRLRAPRTELSLTEKVRPLVKSLRLELNETASFFIREGWELVATVTETAEQSLRYSISVGTRTPMHCLAAGKALLALLNDEELDAYFEQTSLETFTPHTIQDQAALRAELDLVRQKGIAQTGEEYTLGICGIGKASLIDGVAIGAFAVAIPVARFTPKMEERAIALLDKAAAQFAAAETEPL